MKYWNWFLLFLVIILGALYIYSNNHTPNPRQVQQHKRDEYFQQIQQLEHAQQMKTRLDNINKKLEIYKKLAYLYRDGVSDKYDNSGKKIKGVPPNSQKAIFYFRKAAEFGYLFGLFKIAKIYHYGMHNLEPQLEKALNLYKEIAETSPSPKLRQKATALFKELSDTIRDRDTHQWLNLDWKNPHPTKYQYNPTTSKTNIPNLGAPKQYFQGGKLQNQVRTQASGTTNPVNMESLFRATRRLIDRHTQNIVREDRRERDPADGQNDEENLPAFMRNDMHNVHDTGVIGTIRNSIQNLQHNTKIGKDVTTSLREVRGMLAGMPETDKRNDALLALDAIERSYIPLSSTNIREVDALNLVWNRIHAPINEKNAQALRENLVDELAECIEHSKPVCSTGRFTRMLDTLNAVDPEVRIKPLYVLKDEMMEKCGQLREQMMQEMPERERNQLDSLTENETQINFDKRFKERVINEFERDYVQTEIMTKQQLDNELEKWIDVI